MSHASDMIGALSDEIEELEDSDDVVPDKFRADLKAWKQYRVKGPCKEFCVTATV